MTTRQWNVTTWHFTIEKDYQCDLLCYGIKFYDWNLVHASFIYGKFFKIKRLDI